MRVMYKKDMRSRSLVLTLNKMRRSHRKRLASQSLMICLYQIHAKKLSTMASNPNIPPARPKLSCKVKRGGGGGGGFNFFPMYFRQSSLSGRSRPCTGIISSFSIKSLGQAIPVVSCTTPGTLTLQSNCSAWRKCPKRL
jgi:hypothetical protein